MLDYLPEIARKEAVDEALIALPSATGAEKRRIVDICKLSGVSFKTLPGIGELIDGRISVKALRDVSYEDLLGRPQVDLQKDKISNYLADKTVLVTGAGGSIGSELCRKIVEYKPAQIILVDSSEPNLYSIQMEMKHHLKYLDYVTVLANVNDSGIMEWTMKAYRPDVIFHVSRIQACSNDRAKPLAGCL